MPGDLVAGRCMGPPNKEIKPKIPEVEELQAKVIRQSD
jgi:hypothetical protein